MKFIRSLARVTLICNICFVVCVIIRAMEEREKVNGMPGNLLPIPFVKELIIILGFLAIFINAIMTLICVVLLLRKRLEIPLWLVVINFLFLLIEIYFNF